MAIHQSRTSMNKAEKALAEMLNWTGTSETDLYPYVRDLFVNLFHYPKDHIRLTEKGSLGKIPDISLISADVSSKNNVFWIVGEIKRERRTFRNPKYRKERWEKQLKNYISADTVFALFIDPETIVLLRPDGSEIKVVELEKHPSTDLISSDSGASLSSLLYENSVCEESLEAFKTGGSPSFYLDVEIESARDKFYDALRISARELIDFSVSRLSRLESDYKNYLEELRRIDEKVQGTKSIEVDQAKKLLKQRHMESVEMFEATLKDFENQIGRQTPKTEEETRIFLQSLYATEGSSLVLGRILFVRFFEDHGMTMRKISNGGIKAFRDYHQYVKDDYQFLLTDAYKEAEHIYGRLFEPSIFDWSHKGNGQLSKLLLRIFYRLNAFDFRKITGDILGNLYERFLDVGKRKKLGEYYTPMYVARYVLEEIGFFDNPGPILDPACGSGSFLIAALSGLIERLTKKGIKPDLAIKQAVELIHGLDINVFAAFIAQLQMIWHLLPYLVRADSKELPELKIYGGINSLEWISQNTLISSMLQLETEKPSQTRDTKYRYVVGNPPYIRNERLKDTGPWRQNYENVDFRNSDIAYFFVTRAIEGNPERMPSWLDDGGRMCFVLPLGIGDSDAASEVRKMLLRYKILEVTDLEDVAIHIFPSPQASGRATVAPILLFMEKTRQAKDGIVKIVQVAEEAALEGNLDAKWLNVSHVPQTLFQVGKANPFGQILTKIQDDDVPILEKIYGNQVLESFARRPTPCYGISVRGEKIWDEPGKNRMPLGKGQNIHSYFLNSFASKFAVVSSLPDNSIWKEPKILAEHEAFAISTICLSLQCVKFDPSSFSLNSSTLIFVPNEKYRSFPWDCLLNCAILRFVHLLTMRAALVGVGTPIGGGRRAAWCTVYPRVIKQLPVPEQIFDETQQLSKYTNDIRKTAELIATRWKRVEEQIISSVKKPLSFYNIDFSNWTQEIDLKKSDFKIQKDGSDWSLCPFVENQATLQSINSSYELLNVIKFLLDHNSAEILTAQGLQDLRIPEDYHVVSKLIDSASDPNSQETVHFKELLRKIDTLVAKSYGLSEAHLDHIEKRLLSPPLDVLEPRWPWKLVELRTIQEYDTDRFA